jgi:2,4-dienoyl-CoA reductase-like NADH-dependent reductase (Old Yellow Enzyme family)
MSLEASRDVQLLFRPFTVKGVTLANRIVVPPMAQNRPLNRDEGIRWYRRMAAEGPGLVIVEATRVDRFASDYTAENLRPLVDVIHEKDTKAAIQLFPVPIGEEWTPGDVSLARIAELVQEFARAARVCVDAGFDGVELHGAHGYLINQFFSPAANKRHDQYGGSLENRCRFSLELTRACRDAAGDRLLLYRHTPVEKDSYSVEDSFALTDRLLETGVDILDISPGSSRRPGDLAAPFKHRYPQVPVIAVRRLEVVSRAVEVLREGRADLVAVGRGMIVDATWPRKVRLGQFDQIIECNECSVGCFDRLWKGQLVGCVQWPKDYQV